MRRLGVMICLCLCATTATASARELAGAASSAPATVHGSHSHIRRNKRHRRHARAAAGSSTTGSFQARKRAAAPVNTVTPLVIGTAAVGDSLSASVGQWSGSPTAYAYGWELCNSAGAGCATMSGVAGGEITVGSADSGHTIRTIVTATNASGSTKAVSPASAAVPGTVTPPPPPAAPTAAFSFSPSAPQTGTAVAFSASASTCADGPCTYSWSDGASMGSGTSISSTFDAAGTESVTLTVTDAIGRTASVEHNVVVTAPAPAPTPPTAAFTVTPASPVAGSAVAFNASGSTCVNTPCTYAWSDGASLGSGQSLSYTFASAGTDSVSLTVTDADGLTSTVAHSVVVSAAAPAPQAPSDSVLPAVSGTAVEGQTLSVSQGTWGNSPSSYDYAWEDCNTSGASCTTISGAAASTYAVAASDVGSTIRAIVTAANANGHTSATSAQTATVTASAPISGTGCFSSPGSCGYPDPSYDGGNVGEASCSSLPAWSPSDLPSADYYASGNQINILANNVTIQGYNIGNYLLYVDGVSGFTLNHDCLEYSGSSFGGGQDGSQAVWAAGGTTGMTIENSTLVAPGCSTSPSTVCTGSGVDETLIGGAPDTTVENDILAGAVEPLNGLGTGSVVENNYVVANGDVDGAHSEDIYVADVAGITISHNTMFNPMDQSAVIYGDVPMTSGAQPCTNQLTITHNLLGGGGYIVQECSQASGPGTSSMTFTGNDIARCAGGSVYDSALGGDYCGSTAPSTSNGTAVGFGQDSDGYWPNGGFFGSDQSVYCSTNVTWSGNTWTNNGATVACQ